MDKRIVPVLWDEDCFNASIYKEMVQGINNAAVQSQRSVQIFTSCEEMMKELTDNRTAIVIGYESPKLQKSLTALTEQGRQVLLAGLGERFGSRISSASPSRRRATAMLIQYLLSCGKKNIALVACGDRSVNDMERCEILRSFLIGQGCQEPNEHIFYYHNYVEESFIKFLPHWREFDAVICPNDYVALCFIRFCLHVRLTGPKSCFISNWQTTRNRPWFSPSLVVRGCDRSRSRLHGSVYSRSRILPAEHLPGMARLDKR